MRGNNGWTQKNYSLWSILVEHPFWARLFYTYYIIEYFQEFWKTGIVITLLLRRKMETLIRGAVRSRFTAGKLITMVTIYWVFQAVMSILFILSHSISSKLNNPIHYCYFSQFTDKEFGTWIVARGVQVPSHLTPFFWLCFPWQWDKLSGEGRGRPRCQGAGCDMKWKIPVA